MCVCVPAYQSSFYAYGFILFLIEFRSCCSFSFSTSSITIRFHFDDLSGCARGASRCEVCLTSKVIQPVELRIFLGLVQQRVLFTVSHHSLVFTNTRGVRSKLKIISFFLRSKEMHFHVNRKNRKPKLFHFFVSTISLKAFFRRHSTQRYTIIIIFCKQSRINKTRIEQSRTVNDHKRIHLKRRARA